MNENIKDSQPKRGKKNVTRLKFLVVFTKNLGLTDKDIAEKAGCARNSIQYMWSVDDVMIDRIYTIVENCGFTIRFSLENNAPTKQGTAYLKIDKLAKVTDDDVVPARLSFLRIAMKNTGLTTREIAKRLDMSENSLFYYFRQDNTSMSFLNRFAEEFGYDLKVNISENKPKQA